MSKTKTDPAEEVKKLKLSLSVVDKKTQHFDFGEGYAEAWDIALQRTEDEEQNEQYSPMMNFKYPLCEYGFKLPSFEDEPDDEDERKEWTPHAELKNKLNNMTVIYDMEDEEYFLALTGGGMDFSWEICETYINLGFYPPIGFCELPQMSGRGESHGDKIIIEACKQAMKFMSERYALAFKRMEEMYK